MGAPRPQVLLVAHQYAPVPGPATLRLGALVRAVSTWADVVVLTSTSEHLEHPARGEWGELVVPVGVRDATGQSVQRIGQLLHFAVAVRRAARGVGHVDYVIFDPPPTAAAAAIGVARAKGAPAVYYFCDSWSQFARRGGLARRLHGAIARLERWCLTRADLVVAAEDPLLDDARSRGAKDVLLVRNGADVEVVHPVDGPLRAAPPRFIYAGTHSEVHGARIFVEAAEVLWSAGEDFEVMFVGDGTDADWFDRHAARQPRLTRRPAVPLAELGPLLDASVASLVSLSEVPPGYYQIPSKIYTSLAAGCPVLYCGPEGPMRFLHEEAASVCVPRDAELLATEMKVLLSEWTDPAAHAVHRRLARDYAERERDFATNLHELSTTLRDGLRT